MKSLMDVYKEMKEKAIQAKDNFGVYYWDKQLKDLSVLSGAK